VAKDPTELHASAGFPPFDQIETFGPQIFWLAVCFAVLYFALSGVYLPRIRKSLETRDEAIASDLAGAQALNAQAENSVKAFEAKIAEARARARDTASKAKAEADAKSAAETARVEAELAKRLAAAEASIAATRASAMANVSAVAEDAAAAIVEKLTGAPADATRVRAAVAAARGG
jgi:F-type H+-transporting ATPase subunit b